MIVEADRLHRLVVDVLSVHGVPSLAASSQADVLLEGDLRGQHSHGLQRLPVLVERIRRGLIDPRAEAEVTWSSPTSAQVDGRRGLGPVVGFQVVDALLAKDGPMVAAGVRGANHLGMLAPYLERIARAGAIGVVLTTSEALVHPWGGSRAMVGTNPIGIAVPTDSEPFVLDMSTGAISRGKVLNHAVSGAPLPERSAVDAKGDPTTDAALAVDGAVSPFGGPKGFALGLALELVVSAVTGTETGERVLGTLDVEHPSTKGDVFVVVRPADREFARRMAAYLQEVRSGPLARGAERIDVPGDRARRRRAERLAQGVSIEDATWHRAEELLT